MTKTQRPLLKISATLLNSWAYIYKAKEGYEEKAYNDFVSYLNREPMEPNFFMQRGIDFEEACIEGKVPGISEIVKDGVYQAFFYKDIDLGDYEVRLLGYLDVLKEGKIYDIKRVSRYEKPKYYDSYQHHIYMELVEEAQEFTYLIGAGNKTVDIYTETYRRDEVTSIIPVIKQFYKWLEDHNLFEIYLKNYNIGEKR